MGKITFKNLTILVMVLATGLLQAAVPPPPVPPPPPGLPIDSNILVLFLICVLFGFYKLQVSNYRNSLK